ncbi:MAG: RtcB family protein [Elusimicrobiota bacterium]|nr:RtcB family protein [Elusimicrobiota bacterium]
MNANIKRLDKNRLLVPREYKPGMLTDAIIYANHNIESLIEHSAIEQIANVASLRGIEGNALAMPDIHTGYGFPIGGVAAFNTDTGIISPGGVGFDINCGVRLLKTNIKKSDISIKIKNLINELYNNVPLGLGCAGSMKLKLKDEERIIMNGAAWAIENDFGFERDLERMESNGVLKGADISVISDMAYKRGRNQQGTLGSGNHFMEIQYASEIFNETLAEKMGIFKGQITLMIHTGSRGFGHQVCSDFLQIMKQASKKYDIFLADGQLASAPFKSSEGRDYFAAMKGAANYAWCNRQILTHVARKSFSDTLSISPESLNMKLVYDVAHNIAKIENHDINGKTKKLIVHRKGATRAFAPHHSELPEIYKETGQPVIIPGDMGRCSYLLGGTLKAMDETFGSACHGAGRVMSRNAARRKGQGRSIEKEMAKMGIIVKAAKKSSLSEEMSEAYKNINDVIEVVSGIGISNKIAKFKPLAVIKG